MDAPKESGHKTSPGHAVPTARDVFRDPELPEGPRGPFPGAAITLAEEDDGGDGGRGAKTDEELYEEAKRKEKISLRARTDARREFAVESSERTRVGREKLDNFHEDIKRLFDGLPEEERKTRYKRIFDIIDDEEPNKLERLRGLLGWPDDRIEDLLTTYKEMTTPINDEHMMERLSEYGIVPEDLKFIDSRFILANLDRFFERDEAGNLVLSKWAIEGMLEGMYLATNKLLEKASANPDADWQDMYDRFHEGAVERIIRNKISNLVYEPQIREYLQEKGGDRAVSHLRRFIMGKIVPEMSGEIEAREAYHMARKFIVKGFGGPEEMAKFIKRYSASRVSALFKGYHGLLLQAAVSEFERDLHNRIVMNGNLLPSDLFASYFIDDRDRYTNKDYERLKDNLIDRIEQLSRDDEFSTDPEENKKIRIEIHS